MISEKSQPKSNTFRKTNEGLSFSSYNDSSIDAESKPVYNLAWPEENIQKENDLNPWPIQTRSNKWGDMYEQKKEGMNHTSIDMDEFKNNLIDLYKYLKKELQLKNNPKVKLISDEKNANKILGRTAYYEPENKTIHLYITNRWPKDILRSFSHEVIHFFQHENEQLQTGLTKGGHPGEDPMYAENNRWLNEMEKQAFLLGNILLRYWEDSKKEKDRKFGKKGI